MKNHYITATLELIYTGKDINEVLEGLKKAQAARGHDRLFVPVLRGVLRTLSSEKAGQDALVVVSAETDYQTQVEAIKTALSDLGATSEPVVKVDPTLVGGFVAEANYQQINASYKQKLVTLYRSLTK